MSSWDVQFRNGIYLPQIDWWLDAHHPVERSFVSHAHFDHLAPHKEILCSEGTARLMRARMNTERREHVIPFGHTEPLTPDTTVTLHPAGHIYGSAQSLLAHADHGTLLYTGDFKLRRGLSAEPCATPHADVLIMETTFGRPQYVFPPTEKILADIAAFCRAALEDNETPVLFGYSLGKSQELLSGLAAAKLPVMLHPQTHKLTQIYEELGLTFPPYCEFSAAELSGHVVICPPQAAQSPFLKKIRARRTAMITGWALDPGAIFRYQCDAAFPLSDHADFPDLLRFVELVAPKRVLTLHGFSSDFARTLRDRGIEAWAINQDNQLEMPLAVSAPITNYELQTPSDSPSIPSPDLRETTPSDIPSDLPTTRYPLLATSPSDLTSFATTADRIRAIPSKLEKIALLRDYLVSLPSEEDAALAAVFFTGRPFPQSDPRTLNIGWSLLRRAILEVTRLNVADFKQTYLRYSDSGDTAEALLTGRTTPEPFTLSETADFFAALAAARGPAAKLDLFQTRLARLTPAAAKYLIKIITTDLRIGLKEGLVEEAIAAATSRPLESVREANMLSGDLAQVVRAARRDELASISLRIFHPLQFMLASPEPTAEAILERLTPPVWLEEKYDGIRCQLHKQGPCVELFSRDLHNITAQFPDLARAAASLPADVILDGELLAWRDGRALPFAELQKRLGRKGGDDFFLGQEIPISFSTYDLLWLNGNSLLKSPLQDRRTALESILNSSFLIHNSALYLAPVKPAQTAGEIDAAFLASRQRGNEGLMAKDPQSPYTPGRRGLAWLKLKKAYATLDVVVTGVEYGHGKRRGVLSDYTFAIRDDATGALLTVGKAYSGLTDAEIAQYTEHFLANTLEEHGRFRTVTPDVILEVAFDSIQESKRHPSGYALRFPRIARIRTDKTLADIDTLETCRRLAGPNAFAPTKTV
ncbi:DNA ligase [Nibricoccus aquaticus]|uniref:DNA ligase n=1 Tax=Nibricoccus aquaticus TaxID=2576891 RepID=A0A290QEL9_9BACT|nr:ATP-dependent DNA ligase [Nibricoccus aquaticus]ATC62791.1 DNA ligase [Nibricoccus aquaticus]